MTTFLARLFAVLSLLAVGALAFAYWRFLAMPGRSRRGPLAPASALERELATALRGHVEVLAGEVGSRSVFEYPKLQRARGYLVERLEALGYAVEHQAYTAEGVEVANLEVRVPGRDPARPPVVVGAHYDTCGPTPGADDNASGVAGVLELARLFAADPPAGPLRLVAFANEEPPFFKGGHMGSLVYAKACQARGEALRGMLSLEMLGDFRDEPGSQEYPAGLGWVFPSEGNFIAFVATHAQRSWVREVLGAFRRHATVPSEGMAAPSAVLGVDLSDHWSFWQAGYPALMVTDGGPFRNHRYHQLTDTPDTLDYDRMARVVAGLAAALREL